MAKMLMIPEDHGHVIRHPDTILMMLVKYLEDHPGACPSVDSIGFTEWQELMKDARYWIEQRKGLHDGKGQVWRVECRKCGTVIDFFVSHDRTANLEDLTIIYCPLCLPKEKELSDPPVMGLA